MQPAKRCCGGAHKERGDILNCDWAYEANCEPLLLLGSYSFFRLRTTQSNSAAKSWPALFQNQSCKEAIGSSMGLR